MRWQYLGHTLRMSERIGETQVAPASLTLFLSTANLLRSLSNAVIDLWGVEYTVCVKTMVGPYNYVSILSCVCVLMLQTYVHT